MHRAFHHRDRFQRWPHEDISSPQPLNPLAAIPPIPESAVEPAVVDIAAIVGIAGLADLWSAVWKLGVAVGIIDLLFFHKKGERTRPVVF